MKKLTKEQYDALWAVVHQAWTLMDDSCEDHTLGPEPIITVDRESLDALSQAMDKLESLVPEEEGPFWGGYPVSYLLKDLVEAPEPDPFKEWVTLGDFVDPPEPPEGYTTEVERDTFFGIVIKYRYHLVRTQ